MKEYEIFINGIRHTVQMTEDEAKRQGLEPVEKAKVPANKGRRVADK